MDALVYIRLIGFTAGTLLQLFWMVVILGYRRQRNFERVFFFLCLALFLFYSGSLLALNAQIYYAAPPPILSAFATTLLCAGLCFLPPLLMHIHFEYEATREASAQGKQGGTRRRLQGGQARALVVAAYAPVVYFLLKVYPAAANSPDFDFLIPGNVLGRGYGVWLTAALVASAVWELHLLQGEAATAKRGFHALLGAVFVVGAGLTMYLHVFGGPLSATASRGLSTALALLAIVPSAALIYVEERFNFLQIGRQKNLVYAVSATFLALLYLSLVRRLSGWLEPVLPPEATASILLFVLVIFFEPLQRMLSRRLRETAQREMDRVQRVIADIQREARQGNPGQLAQFIEQQIREGLELREVRLQLVDTAGESVAAEARNSSKDQRPPVVVQAAGKPGERRAAFAYEPREFRIVRGGKLQGILHVEPHGAAISGETRAALEFLCEQLPGALDLCRLIEEKVRLERELAERERLAALGQMAASISHNLKNPLGSIKTILQVQMESPELPEGMRGETQMVLEEIRRLSTKLNQLLQFSRPVMTEGSSRQKSCDAQAVVEEVARVLRREAERRGIVLEVQAGGAARARAAAEAVNDIVSNLVVNALEATGHGGAVRVSASAKNGCCVLSVEDDGPGVAAEIREKMLRPFFTTKTQGTGLGLAIVAKRVEESGGKLEVVSPIKAGRGTTFEVRLPAEEAK